MPTATTEFVPAELDASTWGAIEPLLTALQSRAITGQGDFEQWLIDRGELEAAISEAGAILYINMTCDTANDAHQAAYTAFIEEVSPKVKPAVFELDKKHAELATEFPLPAERYAVLDRDTAASVDLFREANVPLQTDLAKLDQEYDKVCGSMTVQFEGKEKTMPQMGVYQESTDRTVREAAWRGVADRRMTDRDAIDALFDQMIAKRDDMARNADCANFVDYSFKAMQRFDYKPQTCFAFHAGVELHVMPFIAELDASRTRRLGLDTLRPWDLGVDPLGRSPLKPFTGGVELTAKSARVFDRLSPDLGKMFRTLGDGSNTNGIADGDLLDLDSRLGKAPGGYQYMQDRSRVPFIFMNAAGLHRDVETMLHEAGHAFHSMLCASDPLLHYRNYPIEIAEVASMSMELLTMPYWDEFYPTQEDADRARRSQLENSIGILPWIATIDAYQHWLYTNPTHSRDDRTAAWNDLLARFGFQGHRLDFTGLEPVRDSLWQRQGHLFGSPFYYIEYGIAQLGALGIWLTSLEQGEAAALDAYRTALTLGGTKPLPDLFKAAGLPFDFGPDTIGRLVTRVRSELDKLPE